MHADDLRRETPAEPLVRVKGLSVWRDEVKAIDSVDLDLYSGELTLLCGENGSGKSTLLLALVGELPAGEGRVDGLDGIVPAYVPQLPPVPERLPLSVRETVAMGHWPDLGLLARLTATHSRAVDRALDTLGLTALASRQLSRLSGGQRQRVMVAQALVRQAPVVLLDEPTAAADAESRQIIHRAARTCARSGALVLLASHDVSAREVCDRMVQLEAGRVVCDERNPALVH
ncbi:ATP-binding cassette domain-containing protein [Schaalia sp. 19OD2882]|uniref:metal ABC transporter ATP-binding protein n=1 Tax=Schaalia sp. 19OD2882 TaxID=2794089 RepID=UPI001C1EC384|nr:ATP-binding cassette domain-containing protein [Schaalia sp. 19OD2882]QWW19893.1 ATP-binding cassette domain-containing protein [Schaalia sp. 19OD2882]